MDVLDHRPGDGQSVIGCGAAANFIQKDQRTRRGGVQDRRRLGHFNHKGGAAAGQVVTGSDAGENPVHHREPLTTTVEGLERYAVNLRYSRDFRENLGALREIIVPTPTGAQVPLGQLAKIETVHAPMGIKSEAAVPNAWIYVDVKGIDIGTYVQMAMRAVNDAVAKGQIKLPSGYNIFWSGQYEYMLRAQQRLMLLVPLTLLIIVLIIYLNSGSGIKT